MLKGVFNWLTKNKVGFTLLGLAAAGFILVSCTANWQASDWIKVKAPVEVQNATGVGPVVSLTDAPDVLERYIHAGTKFSENIDGGYRWLGFLTSLGNVAIEHSGSAIPGGAIGLALVTGLGGLFLKGPGTGKEKNDSYNAGLEQGKRLALAVAAGINLPPDEEDAA